MRFVCIECGVSGLHVIRACLHKFSDKIAAKDFNGNVDLIVILLHIEPCKSLHGYKSLN